MLSLTAQLCHFDPVSRCLGLLDDDISLINECYLGLYLPLLMSVLTCRCAAKVLMTSRREVAGYGVGRDERESTRSMLGEEDVRYLVDSGDEDEDEDEDDLEF